MIILYMICAFLLGSIPFGLIAGKLNGIDVRQVGSGNIGATNVVRALGPKWGTIVFLLDALKGFLASYLVPFLPLLPQSLTAKDWGIIAGVVVIFGHLFSPFVNFKGGKGIATGLGVMLGVDPIIGLLAFSVFLVSMAICQYVSLSSLIAVPTIMLMGIYWQKSPIYFIVFGAICIFIYVKHIANIKRLLKGEEPKFRTKQPKSSPQEDPAESP